MILLTTQGSHIISVPESMYDKEIVLKFWKKKIGQKGPILLSLWYSIHFQFNKLVRIKALIFIHIFFSLKNLNASNRIK